MNISLSNAYRFRLSKHKQFQIRLCEWRCCHQQLQARTHKARIGAIQYQNNIIHLHVVAYRNLSCKIQMNNIILRLDGTNCLRWQARALEGICMLSGSTRSPSSAIDVRGQDFVDEHGLAREVSWRWMITTRLCCVYTKFVYNFDFVVHKLYSWKVCLHVQGRFSNGELLIGQCSQSHS